MNNRFHLVTGAAGAQGSAIVKALLAKGERVRGLTRSASSQPPAGAERQQGDLADLASLRAAMQGITHLTVTLPLEYDSSRVELYARNLAAAAVEAGVRRLVFNHNIRTPGSQTGVAGMDTRTLAAGILRGSGIPMVELQPAVYLENLLNPMAQAAIAQRGELPYPLPAASRVSWISHEDLGRQACLAHDLETLPERPLAIGNAPLSGQELANLISVGIGRQLRYQPLDPHQFEQGLAAFIGPDAAAGVAGIYHWAYANPQDPLLGAGGPASQPAGDANWLTPTAWAKQYIPHR